MATLTQNQMGLVESARRTDPKGESHKIAEVLSRDNGIVQDMVFFEANNTTVHESLSRSSLPTGSWRQYNKGVPSESSTTRKQQDRIGMLESYAKLDLAVIEMQPNPAEFENDEALAFVEGMGQTLATAAIYANDNIDTEQIMGLAPRMSSLVPHHVISNGGSSSGSMTSIYAVQWGARQVYMVYPRGGKGAGIIHKPLGEQTLVDSDGNEYQGKRHHFKIHTGLVVEDARCIKRICNIMPTGSDNTFNEDKLIEALAYMPRRGAGAVIYLPISIAVQAQIKLKDKSNVNWSYGKGLSGEPFLMFDNKRVSICEAISEAETTVS